MSKGGSGEVKETNDMLQQQANNIKLWNYYQARYKPFLNKYIPRNVGNATSDIEADRTAGAVNSKIMQSLPAGGNAVGAGKALNAAAGVEVNAINAANSKVKQKQVGAIQDIIDIGRGQETTAREGMNDIAGQSINKAIYDAAAEQEANTAIGNSIGSAVGAGIGMYNRATTPTPEEAANIKLAKQQWGQ